MHYIHKEVCGRCEDQREARFGFPSEVHWEQRLTGRVSTFIRCFQEYQAEMSNLEVPPPRKLMRLDVQFNSCLRGDYVLPIHIVCRCVSVYEYLRFLLRNIKCVSNNWPLNTYV
jgi:hypothetical protein